ncbi:MAG: DUF4350 domain-containing protein [Pyrinomonadaceae bacterium]
MKQKLLIIGFLLLMVAILAALNAATYTQKEKTPDSELSPNRSSFNSGATGTQAFFTLLTETGRNAARWQEAPAALLTGDVKPAVFVIAGDLRRPLTPQDTEHLLRWVSEGGRLVVIDREPDEGLLVSTSNWSLTAENTAAFEDFSVDPTDQQVMTAGVAAVKAVQPSIFSAGVNAIQPSRLASTLRFTRFEGDDETAQLQNTIMSTADRGPVVHFAGSDKNILIEAPYGEGLIVFLADPYIVSNSGIAAADNAQLAVNLVAGGGLVVFDEFHQGFGNDTNRFLQFFAGTPVVAIFIQAVILVGLVFFSQSRRFARPVPEPEPDRLSKLEYVGAMAELQKRTRAFDLAVENIYSEFRRRAARLVGIEVNQATSSVLAVRLAERSGLDRQRIEAVLFKCEEIIRGEPTKKREVVRLINDLRAIEAQLGMARIPRTRKN